MLISTPSREPESLQTFSWYHTVDTIPKTELDNLMTLAASICQTPIALISLRDENRQWLKLRIGTSMGRMVEDVTFCKCTIAQSGLLEVEDVLLDKRFAHSPLVLFEPFVRFYAGMPLMAANGDPVGVLCVMDDVPRRLTAEQAEMLKIVAHQVVTHLELRRAMMENGRIHRQLQREIADLQSRNEELDAFAHTVAHDLKSPLGLMVGYAELLSEGYGSLSQQDLQLVLGNIVKSGQKTRDIVDQLLLLANDSSRDVKRHPINMQGVVLEARQRIADMVEEYQPYVVAPDEWPTAWGYGPWVEEVWVNYLSNGLKYGGHPPVLELGANTQPDGMVCFWVRDNGPGLTIAEQKQLFHRHTRLEHTVRSGYGLGLSIARRIVEKLGGKVGVESAGVPGMGSLFYFTLPGSPEL